MAAGRPDASARAEVDDPVWSAEAQSAVNRHFSASARYWEQLYAEPTVYGAIHQERRARTLAWIDDLSLPPASRVLEVGCGAGILAADLFRRGFVVDGIDSSAAMVELARARAADLGAADRIRVGEGDAHALAFESGSYDLVVALGVLPFLHSPAVALREFARVLKPGGHVLLSSDNPYRLSHWLDPRLTPLAAPAKRFARLVARHYRDGRRGMDVRAFSSGALARLLRGAGFGIDKCVTLGFGPFTLFARRFLPERVAITVHRRLQTMADRGAPILSATGAQHLVLATLHGPGNGVTTAARR
jgi:SAM-dependent methyltransferase